MPSSTWLLESNLNLHWVLEWYTIYIVAIHLLFKLPINKPIILFTGQLIVSFFSQKNFQFWFIITWVITKMTNTGSVLHDVRETCIDIINQIPFIVGGDIGIPGLFI